MYTRRVMYSNRQKTPIKHFVEFGTRRYKLTNEFTSVTFGQTMSIVVKMMSVLN